MNCAIGNKDVSVRFLSFFIGAAHSFLYCFAKGRNIYEASGVLSSFFCSEHCNYLYESSSCSAYRDYRVAHFLLLLLLLLLLL